MSFTANHLFFDDVEIGQEWMSPGGPDTLVWRQTRVSGPPVNFAGLSGDFNPIHVDHEFAKTTPYHRAIAHGLLIFSISSGLRGTRIEDGRLRIDKRRRCLFDLRSSIFDPRSLSQGGRKQ